MNNTKRWLSVLLCVIMAVTVFAVTVSAAGGATNVAFEVEKTEVNVGDTFTVTLSNKAMNVKGFSAGFTFDNTLLECVSIVGPNANAPTRFYLMDNSYWPVSPTAVSSVDQANTNGTVGFALAGTATTGYLPGTIFTVTFRAKAAGTASFTLYEESNGTDAFKSDNIETKTVTIKSAHTCSIETLTGRDGQGATCTVDGWNNYFECSCGKLYANDTCATEITDLDAWKIGDGKIPADHTSTEVTYKNVTATTHDEYHKCCDTLKEAEVSHNYTTGDSAHTCACGAIEPTGWLEIEDAWYYVNADYTKATGLTRVPYPTVAINGVTYEPNAADKAYWETHQETSMYSDAETAVFYFDADGKFVQYDGIEGSSYFIDGMAPWHVGFVKVGEDYYYFAGDKINGGNVMATGKVYATRTNDTGKANGIYNFDTDGTLIGNYYGLFEQDGEIYYRRSNGELAKGLYYVTILNGFDFGTTKLYFDETTGAMLDVKNGIVEEGGKLYYYENNRLACGKGVVEMTDKDGETYYIYVKSNGQLATGKYWPTNRNDLLDRGEYDWGTDGKYYPGK